MCLAGGRSERKAVVEGVKNEHFLYTSVWIFCSIQLEYTILGKVKFKK
jgi:hypothetical protein